MSLIKTEVAGYTVRLHERPATKTRPITYEVEFVGPTGRVGSQRYLPLTEAVAVHDYTVRELLALQVGEPVERANGFLVSDTYVDTLIDIWDSAGLMHHA